MDVFEFLKDTWYKLHNLYFGHCQLLKCNKE